MQIALFNFMTNLHVNISFYANFIVAIVEIKSLLFIQRNNNNNK